ncbi:MAG: type II secretion system protein GspE [Chitinivibrionales bacterium]|nr:type II secretion system protein GspE [Chitinivibrionales bacterium]MBD3357488.1 type II secretion system protein GspE [Chitinivibrionales bacterium]
MSTKSSLPKNDRLSTGITKEFSEHVSHRVLKCVLRAVAIEYFVFPVAVDETGRLEVLAAYPTDAESLQALQVVTGMLVKPVPASKDEVLALIAKNYGTDPESVGHDDTGGRKRDPGESERPARGAPSGYRLGYSPKQSTVGLVDDILHEAQRLRASDIHLEPFDREMNVRFRIDGVLQEMMSIPNERVLEVTSRLKIMAKMDIAEKRRSQDGRIRMREGGKEVDVRVSTLPTDFGEKIVLRLLDKSAFNFTLDSLGMDPPRLALFRKAIQMPNGIVLLTGPTGSGKTTSLYCAMNYLRKPGVNISTVEDPIEYNIRGVNQTQIHPAIGMTFAHTLRTLLRQDPNIIMVGEMRDCETAEIAIRASLTGHLVLSTLHTNDSPSAVARLTDMGLEPYLVSSSLSLIVAQRLVRRICEHCKCEDDVPNNTKESMGLAPSVRVYKGLGCSLCGHTGYKGRVGIYEVLPVSENIRALINTKAYASEIRARAIEEGMITLRESALAKLTDGTTSLTEVVREISVVS